MAREFAKAFYKSKAWLNCRATYILSVNGLCETCLQKQKLTPGKIVHHKEYITPGNINDPMVTLNHDNLWLECQVLKISYAVTKLTRHAVTQLLSLLSLKVLA